MTESIFLIWMTFELRIKKA